MCGRTRTGNQAVMSDGRKDAFVNFLAFSFGSYRVHRVSFTPFLVRNWCAAPEVDDPGVWWI